jgi:AraC-like DNA-binding protein
LFFRFAAMGPLLLLAALLVRTYGRLPIGWLGALYLVGVIGYLLCPLVVGRWHFGLWVIPFLVGCNGVAGFFWLFTRALFVDGFKPTVLHGVPIIVVILVGVGHHFFADDLVAADAPEAGRAAFSVIPQILSLALIVLAMAQAQIGLTADLVEPRRRFRSILAGVTGAYMIIIVITEILLEGQSRIPELEVLNVGVIFVIAMIAIGAVLRIRPAFFAPEPRPATATPADDARDDTIRDALIKAIDEGRIYLQEGLTITALADQLDTQEYRLRRVINRQLGYRNFNAFLNHYRIKEACRRLTDSETIRLPVLTIAMDLGYRPLGPFNRAFKEETGMTPTEYRRVETGTSDDASAER